MNKNIKSIFFVIVLFVLLLSITALSANDMLNDSIILDNSDLIDDDGLMDTPIKSINTPTKNIKKEEQTTDLYVSDKDGSDENMGTNDSPYKTIEKAINNTDTIGIYNIHIKEGIYKGLGNSNLTIDGNSQVNFIGDGINKTVFDGEAKFIMGEDTEYHWGSSDMWASWKNCTGNWFLEISKGNGKITLINFTVQNGMNLGPPNIGGWDTATVNNYGNLEIDTVWFKDNHGGVGAATRNRENATIYINNSIFERGTKSETTGDYGPALYNNGTGVMENCIITNNYARWGSVTNDRVLTLINCTVKDNFGYDGGSSYTFGSGIATNTAKADYFNKYNLTGLKTTIINCTFEGNQGTDIYHDSADLIIDGCLFNKSNGVILINNENNLTSNIISNNQFLDMHEINIGLSSLLTKGNTYGIYDMGCRNLTIENNTIIVNDPEGNSLIVYSNSTIKNNNITGRIILNNNNNTILYNNITSNSQYAVILNGTITRLNNISNNNIESQVLTGNNAVTAAVGNTIKDNLPINYEDIIITNENYELYFNENGVNKNLTNGTKLFLETSNKNYTLNNVKLYLSTNSQVINTTITVNPTARIYAENLIINNTDIENTFTLNSTKNTIESSTIYSNNINSTNIIQINANNNFINKTTIISNSNNTVIAINLNSSNNRIYQTEFNINSSRLIKLFVMNNSSNNTFKNNIVNVNSFTNASVIKAINSNNNSLSFDKINITSESVDCIEFINSTNNYILSSVYVNSVNATIFNLKSIKLSYNNSIVGYYSINSENNINLVNIENSYNTNIDLTADLFGNHVSGINLIKCNNTRLNGINIKITSLNKTSSILTLNNSNNSNISGKFEINNGNAIILFDSHNNSYGSKLTNIEFTSGFTSTIESNDTGIIISNSTNNSITVVNVTTQSEYAIILNNSENNIVSNNFLESINKTDDACVYVTPKLTNTIENNTAIATITMDNYNTYFDEDGFLKDLPLKIIILGSDFYNKNFTFNKILNIYNANNYTIYNGTITIIDEQVKLHGIIMNSTDNRSTLLNIESDAKISHSSIYHYSTTQVKTIIISSNSWTNISSTNITVYGPEIETEDNMPSTIAIYGSGNIYLDNKYDYINEIHYRAAPTNIEVKNTIADGNGIITALYIDNGSIQSTSNMDIQRNMINVDGLNKAIGLTCNNNSLIDLNGILFNISSNNDSIGLLINNYENNSSPDFIHSLDIFTTSNHTIILNNVTNSRISNGYLNASNEFFAEESIELYGCNNITLNHITPYIVIITTDTYGNYFVNEIFTVDRPQVYVYLESNIYNKNMVFNTDIIFFNQNNYTIYNSTLTFNQTSGKSTINNLNIFSNDQRQTLIYNNFSTYFNYLNIYHESNSTIKTIDSSSGLRINNSDIKVKGSEIETEDNIPSTIAIYIHNQLLSSDKDNINNTCITVDYSSYDNKGSICGIYTKEVTSLGMGIFNNKIRIKGYNNAVGIDGVMLYVRNNDIMVLSNNKTVAVLQNNKTSASTAINNNTITVSSGNNAYAFLQNNSTSGIMSTENNITIKSNNTASLIILNNNNAINQVNKCIINIEAPTITAIDINTCGLTSQNNDIKLIGENIIVYNFNNSVKAININQNNIIINAIQSAIGIFGNGATTKTNKIINNTFIIKGNYTENLYTINLTNSQATVQNNYIETMYSNGDDAIVVNNGITILNNSPKEGNLRASMNVNYGVVYANIDNIISISIKDVLNESITSGNIIYSIDNTTKTVEVVNDNITITIKPKTIGTTLLNIEYSSDKYESLIKDIELQIVKAEYSIIITPIESRVGQFINITAQILANNQSVDINNGKVSFKVNGKTLKDVNGKVIYAKVTAGIATIENYEVTVDWIKDNTIIQAVYSGSTECEKLSSDQTPIIVIKSVPTLLTNDITASTGETITLTATIIDNDKIINTGNVVFKVNGKTVKDVNGKVIYAKVSNNQVTIEYTLPYSLKAKIYNITAVFTSNDYEKIEDVKTLIVN